MLRALHIFALVVLVLAAYHDALYFDQFTFDDHLAIENNVDSHSNTTSPLSDIFRKDFWGKWLTDRSSHKSYRPLTVLSYRAEHWASGGAFNVQRMFWTNVALHGLCTLLVYAALSPMTALDIAFYASALFAVHPVHCEAVAGLVGRSELLSCAFGVLGLICMQRMHLVGSTLFFALACLSKDSAIVFCALYMLQSLWQWTFAGATSRQLRQCLVLCIGLGGFALGGRYTLMHGAVDLRGSGLLRHVENPQHFISDPTRRALYLWLLQWKNAELLFTPTKMCAEYSFNCIRQFESSTDDPRLFPMAAGTAAVVLIVSLLAWNVGRQLSSRSLAKSSSSSLALFFLLFLVIPYSPVSHLFVTVGTLIAERCLYIPSIGACALVALLVHQLSRGRRQLSISVILVFVAGLLAVTTKRVPEWSSDAALFKSAVEVCPNSAKNHQQYALTLYNAKLFDEGAYHLRRAHDIDPNFGEPLYHLARYHLLTQPEEALNLSRRCSRIPTSAIQCLPFYMELREKMRSKLTNGEKLLDTAELLGDMPLQAHQLRQAGLTLINEPDHMCMAVKAMLQSMQVRTTMGLPGLLKIEDSAPVVENNYCNTAYWAISAMSKCPSYSADDLVELAANATTGFCKFNKTAFGAAVKQYGVDSPFAAALGAEVVASSNIIAMLVVNKTLAKAIANPKASTTLSLHRCGLVAEMGLAVAESHELALQTIPHRLIPVQSMRESSASLRHVAAQVLSNCMQRVAAAPKTELARKVLRLSLSPEIRQEMEQLQNKQARSNSRRST